MMKKITLLFAFIGCYFTALAQVTLTTDFTNTTSKKSLLFDTWSVANRISPTAGSGVKPTLGVNLVRMIGGINKKVNNVDTPDLDFDPVRFDEVTNKYVYDWTNLKARINAIKKEGIVIHQLVLDQVPWCFQRGYTFIPTGTTDNINFRENERISTYGNSLPPFDKVAYSNFIKALITELVATYGKAEVESWRLRVGSEIETPDHWYGTETDFVNHYGNTVRAVLSVLPTATIGLHTREPRFLYRNGTEKNYKSEVIKSFADALINYCFTNTDVRYDFWGISDYLLVNGATDRDFTAKYTTLFAPLVDHLKWNKNATCDVMEYSIVTTMGAPDGRGYLTVATPHADLMNLNYTNMFYKYEDKGLRNIYRWGMRPSSSEPPSIEMLKSMNGKTRFLTTKTGTPAASDNLLDAIVTQSADGKNMDALIYNYSSVSLSYKAEENVNASLTTNLPVGTSIQYRYLVSGKNENKLEAFLVNEPAAPNGWIKTGFDRKGDPSRTLNAAGMTAWANFTGPAEPTFSPLLTLTTVARTDGKPGSQIKISTKLGSFELKKYEFEVIGTTIPTQVAFKGIPIAIPGVIEAEDYDKGGEGLSYQDTTIGNDGTIYRPDDVDIIATPTGFGINNTNTGEWREYTIDVAETGQYDFEFLYSSRITTGVVSAEFFDESKVVFPDFALPQTSPDNWTTFQTKTMTNVPLSRGLHVLRFNIVARGFNFDKVTVKKNLLSTAQFDNQVSNEVKVFPNPSNTGQFQLSKSGKWKVYSLTGEMILDGIDNQVDLSNFSKGMYILNIDSQTQKLIYK